MRSPCVLMTFVSVLGFAVAVPLRSQQMPRIIGQSLSGNQVSLPSAAAGSVAIICIGFSHGSQSQLKAWAEGATKAIGQDSRVVVYSVAVLEDAPRWVRGMALRAMKSAVPPQEQARFLVVYQGESELKRVTGFQRPEEAYVLLLDPKGDIQQVSQEPVSDAALEGLAARVRSLQQPR